MMTAKYNLMIGYRGLKIEVLYVVILRYSIIENCTFCIHNWKELREGRLGFDSPSHLIGQTRCKLRIFENIRNALYILDHECSNWIWVFEVSLLDYNPYSYRPIMITSFV